MNDDHKDALERYEAYAEADRINRTDALDDLKNLGGDQWEDVVRQSREADGKPVVTVNKLMQFVNQIAGDLRQSQPSLDLVPVDSENDPILADITNGIASEIEYRSNATSVYNWAAQCSISCGIGHWQYVTEFSNEDTFDQDIRIKRIFDPLSVVWDSASIELDRSDATECFVTEMLTKEQFKRQYKTDKLPASVNNPTATASRSSLYWGSGDSENVRVASHWYKVPTKKTIGLTQEGKVIDLTKFPEEQWQFMGVVRTREVDTHKIMHSLLSGDGVLDAPKEWAGKYIPIVPVIGNETVVDGRLIRHGIIRYAKDPQRLYNWFRSAAIEVVGMQPRSPYLLTAGQVAGHEKSWSKANQANLPYLLYNVDPDNPQGRPQREQPPQGSQAMYQEIQVAENDLYGTTGIYPTSLGQKSNESSGKAIMARDKQSDTGTYVYFDNFKTSFKRGGDILVDLIQKVVDSERIVRIEGKDGQEKMAQINMVKPTMYGQVVVNDLSAGKFDIRVKIGSAFASAREKSQEMLMELIRMNPEFMKLFGDILLGNMDSPIASQLEARIKKTMPQEIVGEGGMPQPQQDPAAQQMAQQAAMVQLQKLLADSKFVEEKAKGQKIDNAHKAFQFGLASHGPDLVGAAPQTPQ